MCGIAGQAREDEALVSQDLIAQMCEAQRHRGPDAQGIHVSSSVGLGIQRLRVIDLETGDQPIYNEDGSVVVVLNGEIYNYASLREELLRKGHSFGTNGDTEVIAHLYEEHGIECVHRLHGMFSFALWDGRRRRLLIARDRVGKKPLYYHCRNGVLNFASELQALVQNPTVPREVDPGAIDAYLAYGYVPAPLTALRDVRKLPPAHLLVFQEGNLTTQRYWRLDFSAKRPVGDPRELHEEIRGGLRAAVARRLVADVPVGAFLSGGIDSAAVVAAMAELSSRPVKTFTIGFADVPMNELPQARRLAEHFSTDHHELVVEPDAVELLPKLVRHYGEPFGDHSALACFHLAQLAREHVTVALNGDGGDECFAGYQRYTTNVLAARLDRLPGGLRRLLASLGSAGGAGAAPITRWGRARRFASRLGEERYERYLGQVSVFDSAERLGIYAPEFARAVDSERTERLLIGPWEHASGAELLDQLLEVDSSVYLPGDLLTKIDIATMAYSLEARSPLLDHELMELAASLPARQKAHGVQRKVALRGALRGWVPDEVLDGPKQGFELPVGPWMRTDLASFTREVLLGPEAERRGWLDRDRLATLVDEHVSGSADHGRKLWSLVMLELWAQESIDSQPAPRVLAHA
jgi:asparagine synthase (glutamine-hydrolysing)